MAQPSMPRLREHVAFASTVAASLAGLSAVPGWQGAASEPCLRGALVGGLVVLALVVLRALGERTRGLERALFALFLGSMPLPYVEACVRSGGERSWLALELLALPVYGALAWLGYRRSGVLLALGTAAHGVLWDSWHLHGLSYLPGWYARLCLFIDLPLALYIAARCSRAAPATSGVCEAASAKRT